jgi:hypothetical protein
MKGFLIKTKILYIKGFLIKTYIINRTHQALGFINSKRLIKLKVII